MTIQGRPTIQEFLARPEQKPYLEFIHGEVRQKSMPNNIHSYLQSQFAKRLGVWRDYPDGFVVTEQRCILQAGSETHTVLPDVAWFSPSRLPHLVEGPVRVAPTLAIEIISPDDSFSDVQEKALLYLAAGVEVVWIVDPSARKVSIFRPSQPGQVLGRTGVLEDPLLPGLSISLADLFAPLPVSPQPTVQ